MPIRDNQQKNPRFKAIIRKGIAFLCAMLVLGVCFLLGNYLPSEVSQEKSYLLVSIVISCLVYLWIESEQMDN